MACTVPSTTCCLPSLTVPVAADWANQNGFMLPDVLQYLEQDAAVAADQAGGGQPRVLAQGLLAGKGGAVIVLHARLRVLLQAARSSSEQDPQARMED